MAGLVLAALVDFGVFNVMIQTVLVGLSAFMVLAWIGEAATKVSIIRMVSLVGGKYCFPFFLTHHYLCEWLTERFSGNTLRRSEVYLLCFACFCLTVAVSRVLFDVNRELFKCLTNSKKSEG